MDFFSAWLMAASTIGSTILSEKKAKKAKKAEKESFDISLAEEENYRKAEAQRELQGQYTDDRAKTLAGNVYEGTLSSAYEKRYDQALGEIYTSGYQSRKNRGIIGKPEYRQPRKKLTSNSIFENFEWFQPTS